ncbi:TPA: hypothetical protein N2903_001671 [Vibrio parahaemolyticus]|nr:hypothetical protein [Vibrio parahaemolyticus]HCM1362427.1 hypothetical protein [Vibrio parahaemolyticus]
MLTKEHIETYAKHMICPPSLSNKPYEGLNAYNNYRFRQASLNYTGNSDPSKMMEKMISCLERMLDDEKEPIILLSDGKDSMSLALALSKMNIKCRTLTLLRNEDYDLKCFIEGKSKQMGHEPYFVEVNDIIDSFEDDLFMKSCSFMDNPVLDQGMIFFLFGLNLFFKQSKLDPKSCQFIDGLGNDEHLGYLPSKSQLKSYKLSQLGLWKFNKYLPNFVNWYIRSPAESQGDLSALSCFFDFKNAYDLNLFFSKIKVKSDVEYIDFRAFSRGAYHDHQCMIGKTKAASSAHGADIVYPWTDSEISEYCFNLPLNVKFNFDKLKNKIILRDLLDTELSWKQEKRGVDLFMDLNISKFKVILSNYVDPDIFERVLNAKLIPLSVKKRALLELLNLSGYLYSNGYSRKDIRNVLCGE